ncbi:MAG: nitroreductase [Dehalococcoidia bacterium]
MDISEAIRKRKSIRGFKPDPIPRDIIAKVLELGTKSPSAENGQPWEITVVTGQALDNMRQENVRKLDAKEPFKPEVHMHIYAGIYKERHMKLASQLYGLMGIAREDVEKRKAWVQRGFRFYDAPVALILSAEDSLDESPTQFDLGCLTQTICLAALEFGLGTCIAGQGVLYPEVARKYCHIPETERIAISIAIGYPDPDFPANALESNREPLENVTTWLGFD